MIHIKVLFFASAREAANNTSETILEVPPDCDTTQFRTILASQYPSLAAMVLDEDSITLALNEEYIDAGQVIVLKDGDTIALIPPISGG
jgi:molybdopterin converting factor subunit 1